MESAEIQELNWMRGKVSRMQQCTEAYVEALARHHVARDSEDRSRLAGICFTTRAELEAIMREEFALSVEET